MRDSVPEIPTIGRGLSTLSSFVHRFGTMGATIIVTMVGVAASVGIMWLVMTAGGAEPTAIGLFIAILVPSVLAPLSLYPVLRLVVTIDAMRQELHQRATTDALTGLANRRHIMHLARQEHSRSRRYSGSLSVVMIDLDHFKAVNDSYGHQAGDHVLAEIAHTLENAVRASDHVGRYGGEEFIAILTETDQAGAIAAAERLRAAVATCCVVLPGVEKPVQLTASIGVSTLREYDSLDDVISRSDLALYEAKTNGRNRVCTTGTAMTAVKRRPTPNSISGVHRL